MTEAPQPRDRDENRTHGAGSRRPVQDIPGNDAVNGTDAGTDADRVDEIPGIGTPAEDVDVDPTPRRG